jgi:hypothetical protein
MKKLLLAAGDGEEDLAPLNAKALLLVDFRPPLLTCPHLPGQLAVRVYDISYPRYESISLYSPRLLIFEDFAELDSLESPSRMAGALLGAWREILDRMSSSRRFRTYLALGSRPLDSVEERETFLFGLVGPRSTPLAPDPGRQEWIEKEVLFPRSFVPPSGQSAGAARPGPIFSPAAPAAPSPSPPSGTGEPPPAIPAVEHQEDPARPAEPGGNP